MDRYINLTVAAALAGVPAETFRQLVLRGEAPKPINDGTRRKRQRYLFDRRDIEAWMRGQPRRPKATAPTPAPAAPTEVKRPMARCTGTQLSLEDRVEAIEGVLGRPSRPIVGWDVWRVLPLLEDTAAALLAYSDHLGDNAIWVANDAILEYLALRQGGGAE